MMTWAPIEFRGAANTTARRAIAWQCQTDRRLVVRHCGHPTALRPYWIFIDSESRLEDLGTFRLLADAQMAALKAVA